MSLWKRVSLGIIRRPIQAFVLFVAIVSMTIAFVFGSFIKDVVVSFYNQFELLQGFCIHIENRTDTGVEKLDDSTLKKLRTYNHIVGINRTYTTECKPLDFQNVPYASERGISIAEPTEQITLIGNMDTSFYKTFRNEFMKLIKGSFPSENTEGIMLDETLVKQNQLTLNSYVSIYNEKTGKPQKVKIVGIYKTVKSPRKEVEGQGDTCFFIESSSYVFCDLATYGLFGETESKEHIINIYIDKRDHIDEVCDSLKSSSLLSKDCFIKNAIENETSGNAIVIDTLKSSSDSMILITFITSILIIFLLTLLWMKKHTYEAGIYLALGTPKYKVIATFLLEIFIISIFAMGVALVVGGLILRENSRVIYDMVIGRNEIYITNHLMEEEVITYAFSATTLIRSVMIAFGVATVATLLASIEIINYKPRNLLSDQ